MVDVETIRANHPLATTIESVTGQPIVKHKIKCPFHEDETPSLHVYDDGGWKCFGCGKHGDVIDFLGYYFFGQTYNAEIHFIEVVDRIGALGVTPLPTPQKVTKPKPKVARSFPVTLERIMAWHDNMPANRRNYWYSRGLNDRSIDEFFLGWDGKRYTIPALYRLQPFGVKRRQSEIDDGITAKYTQVAGGIVGIFNSDALLSARRCIICEGEIDAMLLSQLGYVAVTSTGGAGTWKSEWARHFTHIPEIIILFDNDEAGRNGERLVRASMRRAEIVHLPDAVKDVGELFTNGMLNWLEETL